MGKLKQTLSGAEHRWYL